MYRLIPIVVFALVAGCAPADRPAPQADAPPKDHADREPPIAAPDRPADELIHAMADAYASCSSYQDTGLVRTVYYSENGRRRVQKEPFQTAFVRPDRFRFEFRDTTDPETADHYIVCSHGDDVRTWWDIDPGVKEEKNLGSAIAGATGVSSRSAYYVPTLLLPHLSRKPWTQRLQEISHAGQETVDGSLCYRLRARLDGDWLTLWIQPEPLALRKITGGHQFKDFRTEETITFSPRFNEPVDPSALALRPPHPEL